jgi:myo-inositol-1-phosphate synthase
MYIQQVDQKVNLLESILLDLKISHEITSFSSVQDSTPLPASESLDKPYVPYTDNHEAEEHVVDVLEVKETEPLKPFQPDEDLEEVEVEELQELPLPKPNYEAMSLKELQSLAKSKGVSYATMKKMQLIETLKGLEQSGFQGSVVGSSFLETSAPVSNE